MKSSIKKKEPLELPEAEAQALFQLNKRLLGLIFSKKFIKRKQYKVIKSILTNDLQQGKQQPVEDILYAYKLVSSEILIKEHFKYNQIIVKLAQQFIKNTMVQKLRLEKKNNQLIDERVSKLNTRFSLLVQEITDQYLSGYQKNIDLDLQATGLIDETQVSFLHQSAQHLEIKALDRKFGEIAVKNQFATKDAVNNALSAQTQIYLKTSKNLIIGDILVDKKEMTVETRDEILLLQNRVFEEDWEETLKSVGQSTIEEQEQNALFGALVVRDKLMDQEQVIGALKIQNKERKYLENLKKNGKNPKGKTSKDPTPRWIGDILVDDFGMSDTDRKKIIKEQMQHKLEMINLKFGINLKDAHRELFRELDTYFQLLYSKNRLQAFLKVTREIPTAMTRDNIKLWLYHKKIIYGRSSSSINNLLDKKTSPGDKLLIANGDMPVPETLKPIFNFDLKKEGIAPSPFPPIVKKGEILATVKRIPGQSGLNVNRCFVSPPSGILPISKGCNIVRKNKAFLADCDGVPQLSDQGVVSISPLAVIKGNVSSQDPTIDYHCDIDVRGIIESDVLIRCRKFMAHEVKGQVVSEDDVVVHHKTVNAHITSKGDITLASIYDSRISGEKNIIFQSENDNNSTTPACNLTNSLFFCNDTCKINNTTITSSIFRARKRIYIRDSAIGEDCKFIIGDSNEISDYKINIQKIDREISQLGKKIDCCQDDIRTLFTKMEKKDISAINDNIAALSKQPRKTKEDLDSIRQLKKAKREKEREFEKKYNEYGTQFTEFSTKSKGLRKKKQDLERLKKALTIKIISLYKDENDIPELDARRATIPKGTTIQFRHTVEKTDCDYKGFIFREELNDSTHAYEIQKHRW